MHAIMTQVGHLALAAFSDAACLQRRPRIRPPAAGRATSAAVGPGRPSRHTHALPLPGVTTTQVAPGRARSTRGSWAVPASGPGRSGRSPLPKAACSACPVTSNPRQPASSPRCAARTSCGLGTPPVHRPAGLLPGRGQRGSSVSCGQRADLAAFFEQLARDAGFTFAWQHLDAARNIEASAAVMRGDVDVAPTRKMLDAP